MIWNGRNAAKSTSAGIADGTSETWMNSAIHYGNSPEDHRQEYHAANVAASLQDGNYHTYTLDWTENSLTVSVDGNLFHTFDISKMSGRYDYFHGDCYRCIPGNHRC